MSNALEFHHIAIIRARTEFRARSLLLKKIGEPHRGVKETGIRRSPDRGISVVTGRPLYDASPSRRRPSPKVAMIGAPSLGGKEICEVRFDRWLWTPLRALEWLEEVGITPVAFLEARPPVGEM